MHRIPDDFLSTCLVDWFRLGFASEELGRESTLPEIAHALGRPDESEARFLTWARGQWSLS
jgi:hypothetical protein